MAFKATGATIREFILDELATTSGGIAQKVSQKFGITRQAANRHLQRAVAAGLIESTGSTRSKEYTLSSSALVGFRLPLNDRIEEDVVWRERVAPAMSSLPDNIKRVCVYGFTEILNNAVDHSGGTFVDVKCKATARSVQLLVADDGVGIFRKIAGALELANEGHAILELTKGKLTTDRARHSGEGIFFTSRMFDSFGILSHNLYLGCRNGQDWLIEDKKDSAGTCVMMKIDVRSKTMPDDVFSKFTTDDAFAKTIVPVFMTQYGDDNLVSRSQAKRLLARVERFKEVMLDFDQVHSIGQAFADEVFRVFTASHPDVHLFWIRANPQVEAFIRRAEAGAALDRRDGDRPPKS